MQSSKGAEKQRQIYHLQAVVFNEAVIIMHLSTGKDETQVIKAKMLISNHSIFLKENSLKKKKTCHRPTGDQKEFGLLP